ncbi:MAG: RHS repeat domain-containing protein [Verrucomicrobiota bacterium]
MKTSFPGWLVAAGIVLAGTCQAFSATAHTYNKAGHLMQTTYSDGRQVNYSYDPAGNLLAIATKNDSAPVVVVSGPLEGKTGDAITNYQIQTNRQTGITGYVVAGLPLGLTCNATTGVISGTPRAGGAFLAKLQAKNKIGTSAPATLRVEIDNPFASVGGTFNGVVDPASPALLGGKIQLTLAPSGLFTGTLVLGAKSISLKGEFDGSGNATVALAGPPPLTLTLNVATTGGSAGSVTGTLDGGSGASTPVSAWRNVWSTTNKPTDFSGAVSAQYVAALDIPAGAPDPLVPQGNGWLTAKIASTGLVSLSGKLADGTLCTASVTIWPDGTIPVFLPLYTSKGVLAGELKIVTAGDHVTANNTVSGTLTWIRPDVTATKPTERLYKKGFDVNLTATGAAYVPPATGFRVLGLGNGTTQSVLITIQINEVVPLPSQSITRSVTVSVANLCTITPPAPPAADPNLVKLTVNKAAGTFSGSFTEPLPLPARSVTFDGLFLPALGADPAQGVGFFLLPGTTTSPIYSGQIIIGP